MNQTNQQPPNQHPSGSSPVKRPDNQVIRLNFHGEDLAPVWPDEAGFEVIPVPYEETVSYQAGTARGPEAILKASTQLELFDGFDIPGRAGIYTHAPVDGGGSPEKLFQELEEIIGNAITRGSCPVMLGGEHSISLAAARATKKIHPDCGIVQFDAHADLRDRYQDNPFSHACVMRRIHELGLPIIQIGTRGYALEEHEFRHRQRIAHVDAAEIYRLGPESVQLPDGFPEKIYLTFDIDVFDPAIIPSTGTPVPGGLNWYQVMEILGSISSRHQIIGFDLVELAPLAGLVAPDFTAAQLVYNLMGMIQRRNESLQPQPESSLFPCPS